MITKLTTKQQKQVPAYLKKWLDVGLRTKVMDKNKATKAVHFLYDMAKADRPKYLIFLDSPMAVQLACNIIKNSKFNVRADSQLGSQLRSQLDSQLRSQLRSQLESQLGSQLDSQLDSQLGSQLDSQLDSQLGSAKLENFSFSFSNWYYWSAHYYWQYEYILNELFPKKKKDFKLFLEHVEHSKELHYVTMFKEIAFVSDFPKEINRNADGRLHATDKPALLYRDSYAVYASNGIRVTKEFVETPADKFTKEMIVKETNADIRREAIRKVGIERIAKLLDYKTIDKMDDYELITFDIGDGRVRPFLKMINPSVDGLTHIEGVRPEIKTVKDAIVYRNKLTEYAAPKALS